MWPDPEDPACNGIPEMFKMNLPAGRRLTHAQNIAVASAIQDRNHPYFGQPTEQIPENMPVGFLMQRDNVDMEMDSLEDVVSSWPGTGWREVDGIYHRIEQQETQGHDEGMVTGKFRLLTSTAERHSGMRLLLHSNPSQQAAQVPGVVPLPAECPGRGKPERASLLPHWFSTSWSLRYRHSDRSSWNCSVMPPTQVEPSYQSTTAV
jgi:hypothetical protein